VLARSGICRPKSKKPAAGTDRPCSLVDVTGSHEIAIGRCNTFLATFKIPSSGLSGAAAKVRRHGHAAEAADLRRESEGCFGKRISCIWLRQNVYRCPAGEKLKYYFTNFTNEENGQKLLFGPTPVGGNWARCRCRSQTRADIKLAGGLSLAVSLPTMILGFTRQRRDRSFAVLGQNRSLVVLPPVPSCLVLDIRMPRLSGFDLQAELSRLSIKIPVIFITGHGDIPMTVRAMKAGAVDFLTKPFRDQEMLEAVTAALERDQKRRTEEKSQSEVQARFASLTPRERQVMALVTGGLMNKQVAGNIGITERTVKIHRGNLMRKMHAKSLAELVVMAQIVGIRGQEKQEQ
jgi:FixJ family two-component response regulator